ncbi:aromatic ring-hydroxylating oxygenase subunit alpha [Hyphococcus sp.]|jgi:Rieske 2Fe-2S family protein|uniref:aromatic ring-hydroxylating oxygenase subunit alpha n=1 Tax=Hyphococcus sp. TaxID=2038636 RepID=UPI003D108D0F
MPQPEKPAELEKSLPSSFYTDALMFERERRELFARSWVCAGREEEVEDDGSTKIIDLFGESIIVARLKDGSLRAHYNVCRHRGARMCSDDAKWGLSLRGGAMGEFIRCPYHQWTYGLDGRLVNAPQLSGTDGFDAAKFSLHPVGVAVWGGFIFLKLDPAEGDLISRTLGEDEIGPAPRRLGNYPLARLKTARAISYEVAANWKVIAENYNECYHCGGVHPELCAVVPVFRAGAGLGLDWENGVPHREGAWTYTFSGTTNRKPFEGLSELEKIRHKGELIYPNLMLSVSADHGAAFILWPLAPNLTRVDVRFLFDADEMARDDFEPSDAVDFWDITNRQDWAVCERVQQGMSSRAHDHGYYAPMEDESLDIRRYIAAHIKDA